MSNIFTQKDPPFIFAILLVTFSWATSHVVTRTIEKPIIEVHSSISPLIPDDIIACLSDTNDVKHSKNLHTFLLTNISKDRLFQKLSFLVTTTGGNILGVRIRALSPAVSGDTPESCSAEYGSFRNVTLHPRWQYKLEVVADKNAELALRLSSASEAVNLKESNIETWLVRNESLVLILFIIVIGISAVAYLAQIAQSEKKKPPHVKNEGSEGWPQ